MKEEQKPANSNLKTNGLKPSENQFNGFNEEKTKNSTQHVSIEQTSIKSQDKDKQQKQSNKKKNKSKKKVTNENESITVKELNGEKDSLNINKLCKYLKILLKNIVEIY